MDSRKIKLFGFGLDEKLAAHLGPEAPLYVTAAALDYQSGYDAGELALALSRGVAMPAEVRKAVRVFTGPGKDVDQYLKKPSAYMQPTLPALPDAGSGIKPSCNCQPEAHPVQPTAAP